MAAPALRPLSIAEILDVSFGLYRRLFGPLIMVTLVCTAVPLLVSIYIQAAGGVFQNVPLYMFTLVLSVIASSIATGATVFIVSDSYLGRTTTASEALHRAIPYIARFFLLSVLSALVVFFGLILLIVPGVVLACGLAMATPVLVLESSGSATDAMGRSWALSRGSKGKIFLVFGTLLLISYVPVMALAFVGGLGMAMSGQGEALSHSGITAFTLGAVVVGALIQLLIRPMIYCALTVTYYDLRVRKEGFDLEVLAGALRAT